MQNRREGFFLGSNRNKLFFQSWENPKALGTVFITHGQGEHSECYHRLIHFFSDQPWNFVAWDLRGHGRSEGKRGYAPSLNEYVADYKLFLQEARAQSNFRKGPAVLLSHSLGGLIQVLATLDGLPFQPRAHVLSAPLFGLTLAVPKIKQQASSWLNRILPQVTLWNEIENTALTRDPDVIREFEADVLRHGRISAGVFLGMLSSMEIVKQRIAEFKDPVFIQCPNPDPVVSTPATTANFEAMSSVEKSMLTYGDGACHEMYNDIHREEVFKDLKKYLESLLSESLHEGESKTAKTGV